ncbi:hypothetical protein Tco_1524777 [Tanacetum coccineum]
MACHSSGSDTEVISCSNECKESYAKLKKLYDAQREQLSDASIEIKAYTQGLKKVEAQLVAHQQGQLWYEEKIRFMKIDLDDKTDVLTYHKKLLAEAQKEKEDLKAKVEKWHNSSKNLGKLLNTQMSANDKFRLGFVTAGEIHVVPPPMTGNYMPSGPDVEIDYSQFTYGPKQSQPSKSKTPNNDFDTCESGSSKPTVNEPKVVCQPKIWSDAPILDEYESDSEDEHVSLQTEEQETPSFANQQVKSPRETVKNQFTHSKNPKVDKKGSGYGFTARACFVCGSLSHLIRDCDFHEKRMAKQAELNNSMKRNSSQREIRPIWNNVQRVNHMNQFVPIAVLTRTGKILVNTARASVRPKTVFHKTRSPFSRPFNNTTALRTNFTKQKVNTAEDYPHRTLQNKGIVDSGCSRHMTGNKAYLAEYQDSNGGPIKKLKKKAKSVWMKSVSLKQRLAGKKSLKSKWMQKESVSKQGWKSAKAEPSVHKDPLFDELPEDTLDYMETEDAQDVGRTRKVVNEEKETVNDEVSTEDVLSTAQQKVSTDKKKVSTDRPNVSTNRPKVSTDKEKDSIVSTDEGTVDQTERRRATPTTPTTTPTMFGDDETIAQVLLNMSQAKAVSREKEKGVELMDVEEMRVKDLLHPDQHY